MQAVYIDNFRGFSDTLVPLTQMNFLVGENSTGKSSLLALMQMISNPNFLWLMFNLQLSEIDLGNFEDIVSAESSDKSYFTIGYVTSIEGENKKSPRKSFYFIVTYKNDKDGIKPIKFSYSDENGAIVVKLTKKTIRYRIDPIPSDIEPMAEFKSAIAKHRDNETRFKNLSVAGEDHFSIGRIPFIAIRELVNKEIQKEKHKRTEYYTIPHPLEKLVWLAPIREKPRRIYDNLKPGFSPEGIHTPYILNELLNKNDKNAQKLSKALSEFGLESGLFKELKSNRFGKSEAAPFEINVTLSQMPIKISNVGYGVAQVLPIIVESFVRRENCLFCIQQPEVHLHPRAQAALGSFFYKLVEGEKKSFLIETHSDFLIDKYRISLAKAKNKKPSSQVLFFERVNGNNTVSAINIESSGSYSEDQPASFRDFFFKQQIELLSI